MVVKGGNVFLNDCKFHTTDLHIENGIITEITDKPSADEDIVDAVGFYVIPGLCDIHTHGAMGFDFSDGDEDGLRKIAEYERSVGVTSFCPTTMTIPKEELISAFKVGGKVMETCSNIVGFHMEGPFISPEKKGAQKEEDIIAPDYELFEECNRLCGGMIKEITVAPEMEGVMDFIDKYSDVTKMSVGHTMADYDTAMEAMAKGANHLTHMFNAMPPFTHRQPGPIGAALDTADCVVELICDGVHIHDSVIRAAFNMFGERIALISDSMRACGLPDGDYTLGGQSVHVKGNVARLDDGNIAASVTNLFDCMKYVARLGIPFESAVRAATYTPAASIGISDTAGVLDVGRKADILLVDKDFNLKKVL